MRRASWAFAVIVSLAGCPYQIPDGRFACASDDDCPVGFACNDATCDRGVRDASVADGGDGGAPLDTPLDAPACAIDMDGDGACADVDCDDENGAVRPGAAETCTASESGLLAVDENCDGVIDEGCAYHVGVPHWVTDVLTRDGVISAPLLSFDGLSLYACTVNGIGVPGPVVARRSTRSERFGRLTEVAGDWGTAGLDAFAMSPDGLEALGVTKTAEATVLRRYTRAATAAPFTFEQDMGAGLAHPSFSPNGLDMIVATATGIALSHRTSLGTDFPVPTRMLSGPYRSPSFIEPDVLVLLDTGSSDQVVTIARLGSENLVVEGTLPSFGPIDDVTYDIAGRELIFASARAWTPVRPVSPSIWRAEVCRDGACPTRDVVCDVSSGEVRSVDGTHCYRVDSSVRTWADGAGVCGNTREAHPLSLHSLAERDAVSVIDDDLHWTGGNLSPPAWTGGEAWTATFFGPGWPTGADACVTFSTAVNETRDSACASGFTFICETELWPTW